MKALRHWLNSPPGQLIVAVFGVGALGALVGFGEMAARGVMGQ